MFKFNCVSSFITLTFGVLSVMAIWNCDPCAKHVKRVKERDGVPLLCGDVEVVRGSRKVDINTNSGQSMSVLLDPHQYGIEVVNGPKQSSVIKHVDRSYVHCVLKSERLDAPLENFLTISPVRNESRSVSISQNSGAFVYHLGMACSASVGNEKYSYRLFLEPIKVEFPLEEPQCIPEDLLIPQKPDDAECYIHFANESEELTNVEFNTIRGISFKYPLIPSDVRFNWFDHLTDAARQFFDKYFDKLQSLGFSERTHHNWTKVQGGKFENFRFGAFPGPRPLRIKKGEAIQSVTVVGVCGDFRTYQTHNITRDVSIMNKTDLSVCISGAHLFNPPQTFNCPPKSMLPFPTRFPKADPEYWSPQNTKLADPFD